MIIISKLKGTVAITAMLLGTIVSAQTVVGGAKMSPSKTIVENASASIDHETLVAAVKAADLVEILNGEGPFTVFAPTDAAFDALPAGAIEELVSEKGLDQLRSILKYHVISGDYSSKDVMKLIKENKGKASVITVDGTPVDFVYEDGNIYLQDMNGHKAQVTIADVKQKNGMVHVIDKVLTPELKENTTSTYIIKY